MNLPKQINVVAQLAVVCESAGLERLDPEQYHPNAWVTPDRTVAVAAAGIGHQIFGIAVNRILDWDPGCPTEMELATVRPGAPPEILLAVIEAARQMVGAS